MQVIKRDGTTEDFQTDKIIRVVMAAGLEEPAANELAASVSDWIKSNTTPQVTSIQIRDKVVELLLKYDKYAHDLFVWYEHTKDQAPKS